jgi:sulfur-oxidizing protein SoxA
VRWPVALAIAALAAAGTAGAGLAEDGGAAAYQVDGRRSGYTYLSEPTRALQDDAFANPGMLWVARGQTLWRMPEGAAGKACVDCHGDAATSMRGVRARYPAYDPQQGKPVSLEQRINQCRSERIRAAPWAWESEELLAMTAFVGHQSRGMLVEVRIDGPMAPFFERGKAFWLRRRGQLDLACSQCHDELAGRHLYGDVLSQGQSNGFPVYRMLWQTMGSLHRMFRWCNSSVRAEPYPFGADAYVNLELYLAWRGRGLSVETPAVRR